MQKPESLVTGKLFQVLWSLSEFTIDLAFYSQVEPCVPQLLCKLSVGVQPVSTANPPNRLCPGCTREAWKHEARTLPYFSEVTEVMLSRINKHQQNHRALEETCAALSSLSCLGPAAGGRTLPWL